MAGRRALRVLGIWAAAAAASCGGAAPSASTPLATAASPTLTHLAISVRCSGPFRGGAYYPSACIAEVSDPNPPGNAAYAVGADLRVLGGPAEVIFPKCPACGGPPWTFDIDLRIPADTSPGVKTIPVWVTDTMNGRRADTTVAVPIVAP